MYRAPVSYTHLLALPGGSITLAPEDLLIETVQAGRYHTMEEGGVAVALDTQLTDALVEEGYAVSYTHLDVYKRQALRAGIGLQSAAKPYFPQW